MSKRAVRDAIAVGATAAVLGLFAYYMSASTQSAVDEAERNKPPVLEVRVPYSYMAGDEILVDVELANTAAVERRLLEPVWPATLRFDIEAPRRRGRRAKAAPAVVWLSPGGRLRRRIDLYRIFELPAGEYVLRVRYEAPAEEFEGMGAWTGRLSCAPVRLKVVNPFGPPEEFTEMEE